MRSVFGFACLALPLMAQVASAPSLPTSIQNGDFMTGELGQSPSGWTLSKASEEAGFQIKIAKAPELPGARALTLGNKADNRSFGSFKQVLDATPYRGKRIRLCGQLRISNGIQAKAQLWLRVDRPGQQMGFFDNMDDRPIVSAQWTPAEIIGDVARDAKQIVLGAMLFQGRGVLWAAPMTLEILGDTPTFNPESPRPLTEQGTKNLVAYTRAFNLVRFFHPSDEASRADWNRLAAEGIRATEGARSPIELAERLNTFFAPYAPTAQFCVEGQTPKPLHPPEGAAQLVRWVHTGFGQNKPGGVYASKREYSAINARPTSWKIPEERIAADLGGGVLAYIPSVCFSAGDKTTLPKAISKPIATSIGRQPDPTVDVGFAADDRATRLGDIALSWGIFQHFFPYFDATPVDWSEALSVALKEAAEDANTQAFLHTLKRFTAKLRDGHIRVNNPQSAIFPSPGLVIRILDGQVIIIRTGKSAQAIPLGSTLLEVNGEPIEHRMARLRSEISSASPGWTEARMQEDLWEGGPFESVRIRYKTPTGVEAEATLPRISDLEPTRPDKIQELRPGVWYLDLDRITDQDFAAALPNLVKAKGVVFDLRGYPRLGASFLQYLANMPIQSARWNVPIVTDPDGRNWSWDTPGRWNLLPLKPHIPAKVAFLTGGGAISYAESCLGIVEAYRLGEIVGEPTAGTNGNINPFRLPGNIDISWTGMKVLKHDGSRHHGVGIHPTIPVAPTLKGIMEGRDEVLEKGLEVVSR